MRDAVVVMAVTFTNDSITTQYTHISSDSHQTLMVDGGDSLWIKNIRGYFMMLKGQEPTTTFKMLILNNIQLVRMHVRKQENVNPGDSTNTSDPIRTIGGTPVNPSSAPAQGDRPPLYR